MTPTEPTADLLADWVQDATERALQLVDDLDDEQLVPALLPVVNPLIWELGYLAWSQEKFVLRDTCGQPPLIAHTDALYDSGAIPHDTRWHLMLPSRKDTVAYLREVSDRIADILRDGTNDVVGHFARYTVHHYDTHTYTRQTLGYPPPLLPGLGDATTPVDADAGPLAGDAHVDGAEYLLGALRSDPFVFDNEKWAHPVQVAPFAIGTAPVTQAEFAAFVDDGGYRDLRLWSDGGRWLAESGAQRPVYWGRADGGWQRRVFDRWVDLEPHRPVSHVCWWEADARPESHRAGHDHGPGTWKKRARRRETPRWQRRTARRN